jgi:Zn-dependent protease
MIAASLFSILIALSLHEYGHAAMADKLGDPTPRSQKRLTLNPLAHLDPLGTLMIVIITLTGFPGLGWGKPVITNPLYYRNYRTGRILVALAGPAMNLALAMLGIATAYVVFIASGNSAESVSPAVQLFFFLFIMINFGLMIFNLIPIPPLDGHHVLAMLLPPHLRWRYERLGNLGIILVLVMMWFGILGMIYSFNISIITWLVAAGFGNEFAAFIFPFRAG